MEERFPGIERRLDNVEAGQLRLEAGQRRLEVRLDKVEMRLDKVEIRLEDLCDQVKQVAEGHSVILSAIASGFNELDEKMARRFEPIEAALFRRR